MTENAVPATHAITRWGAPPASGCAMSGESTAFEMYNSVLAIGRLARHEPAAARDPFLRPGSNSACARCRGRSRRDHEK